MVQTQNCVVLALPLFSCVDRCDNYNEFCDTKVPKCLSVAEHQKIEQTFWLERPWLTDENY